MFHQESLGRWLRIHHIDCTISFVTNTSNLEEMTLTFHTCVNFNLCQLMIGLDRYALPVWEIKVISFKRLYEIGERCSIFGI